jgi:hypothetical protein
MVVLRWMVFQRGRELARRAFADSLRRQSGILMALQGGTFAVRFAIVMYMSLMGWVSSEQVTQWVILVAWPWGMVVLWLLRGKVRQVLRFQGL